MFEKALEKLEQCIKRNDLNYSAVREVALKEIAYAERGLCADEIHQRVNEKVQKKVSYNTVYRVLRLFEECGIVITIQSNAKKTHYFLADVKTKLYLFDVKNHQVSAIKAPDVADSLLKELDLNSTHNFIVIHKN
ncbi:MAG: transcriptional repressor [Epsilonproteobacteria bacterium]|nr:transcriptional repressor [Campylobacterota bacterium]